MATAPTLGTAANFAVLGGSAVTNTGPTTLVGDLGVSPGTAISGFPPGRVAGGTIHRGDAVAAQAEIDNTTAYNVLAGEAVDRSLTGQDLGGKTLTTGVYQFSTSAQLTGSLTLDAQGNPNAVFVFQIGSTLTTASNSSVLLVNGADACNVFWQVGSSATLGTRTAFEGNILALTSITLNTGATIASGRALARNGAVTLDSNTISNVCAPPSPIPSPSPSPNPSPNPSPSPNPTPNPNPNPNPTQNPTQNPTLFPTLNPTQNPTQSPTQNPTQSPTQNPTQNPTLFPTQSPTQSPTQNPTPMILLRRFGYHAQPTTLVLTFRTPLDQPRAQDVSNYQLVTLGGHGRGGSRHGHPIAIRAATYDPTTLTVTLQPGERLDVHNRYLLRVNMTTSGGLTGATGAPLGGDFAAEISRSTLVGPAPGTFTTVSVRRAHPLRVTPGSGHQTAMSPRHNGRRN